MASAHSTTAPRAPARRGDLLQLEQVGVGYPSRERLLSELTLHPPDASSGQACVPLKGEGYLILSTIHAAKGQERRSVFVLNCVDGCIPPDPGDTRGEKRQLLYVAMTRAKDSLTLGVPLRFYVTQQSRNGDRHLYAVRTRFTLKETLEHLEPVHAN